MGSLDLARKTVLSNALEVMVWLSMNQTVLFKDVIPVLPTGRTRMGMVVRTTCYTIGAPQHEALALVGFLLGGALRTMHPKGKMLSRLVANVEVEA